MPYIENPADIQWYREKFSDIWRSATLTYSSIEVNGIQIPNGELKFSRESCEEGSKILYREGALSIYEVSTTAPFDLLEQIISGKIPIGDGTADIKSELRRHNPSNYFQDGVREGRVRETRPRMEVNAAVSIDIPEDVEDEYSEVVDELDDQLMRADEPYYDLGCCEGYYFDYIFRSDRETPAILLFADSGMDFSISESGTLKVVSPTSLFEELFVSVLPQKPYDEHKGWQIRFDENQLESLDDCRSRYTEDLELEDIDELYAVLYLEDEMVNMVEHITGDVVPENPRYEIMQAFDQDNNLEGYLEGHNADYFEVAVVNALSTAGWLVQWYGDDSFVIPSFSEDVPGAPFQEIDVIAYHPENTQILFIEWTNQDISKKEQILDRTQAVSSVLEDYHIPTDIGLIEPLQTIPCVATPQKPTELSDDVVDEFEEKGIKVLHSERLQAIYAASQDTTETVDVDT
ncbi:hypothetical protein [Halosimplex pelagicum]|uniref:Uncharacterized protein n=1 Tax=Halosimplex pelagicum TaxID=869886 RepID=A0A7D5TID5_9EURY|nr:hypothetical protein [Halosimplex pelagicum]QLH83796.1 hypothetical protein HZS54_20135 [Halosimplex pelagicum]